MNLDPAMAATVDLAIREYSQRLIDHPQIERDPVCVIATLREDACASLYQSWGEYIEQRKVQLSKRRAV